MNLCSGCSTVLRGVVLICVVQKIALATPTCPPLVLNLLPNPFPSVSRLSAACLPLTSHSSPLVRCWFPQLFPACLLPLVCLLSPACRPFLCLFPACLPLLSLVCRRFVSPLSSTRQVRRICLGKIGAKDYRTCARGPNSLRPYIGLHGQSHLCTAYGWKPSAIFSGAVNFMALPPPLQECCGNLSRALRELFGLLWTFCILG